MYYFNTVLNNIRRRGWKPVFLLLLLMSLLACLFASFFPNGSTKLKPLEDGKSDNLRAHSPWSYRCEDGQCVKVEKSKKSPSMTLNSCKMTCGKFATLWPYPTGSVKLGLTLASFIPQNLHFTHLSTPTLQVRKMLAAATEIFYDYLNQMHPSIKLGDNFNSFKGRNYDSDVEKHKVNVEISLDGKDTRVTMETDESYELRIRKSSDTIIVQIMSSNYFGARHALESLSQLISFDEVHSCLQILTTATVYDKPLFPHRGILIDTSRNFFSVKSLKKLISAMSYNKLNTLHWHITDTQSFPLYIKRVPQMTLYGAYSPSMIYSPQNVQDIVEYGRIRGVRIIPEFDTPAHVGNGWQWGPKEGKGELALCLNKEPWFIYCHEPPCGQLNPINNNVYKILGEIFKDMLEMFDSDAFHMGGDEVKFACWNTTQEILDWMKKIGLGDSEEDFLDLWGLFQKKALQKLEEANGGKKLPVIYWTSRLTVKNHIEDYLDKNTYIIQIWMNSSDDRIADIVEKGYRVIFSNSDAWYLDCGYGAWVGEGNNWCSPYKSWQLMYENSPYEILKNFSLVSAKYRKQVLGGEAAMWSEQVDENAAEGKLWPRSAALAERLWSNPETGWEDAEIRFVHHRERLVERGVAADAVQPLWCHLNEGFCYGKTKEEIDEMVKTFKQNKSAFSDWWRGGPRGSKLNGKLKQ